MVTSFKETSDPTIFIARVDGVRVGRVKLYLLGGIQPGFWCLLDDGRLGEFRRDAFSAVASALNSPEENKNHNSAEMFEPPEVEPVELVIGQEFWLKINYRNTMIAGLYRIVLDDTRVETMTGGPAFGTVNIFGRVLEFQRAEVEQ